ncbi:hypothetical protein [Nesterenkonia ebinurensis]|uniref:hypothetical protein n=1 Tax=Nesterenkonia ebinurensis TaxID=2608252 RepID=UPI001CC7DE7F|nr:hypothetical protein [Nesterenkonia ebinurensis]
MAKILCVLYPDPVDGYPPEYARDALPRIEKYPGGQTLPTPSSVDFSPGELLGSESGELGLRTFLEETGHKLVVTTDKEGARLGLRPAPARCRGGHLPAVLAGLSGRRAAQTRREPQAGHHRRDHLFELHQRL